MTADADAILRAARILRDGGIVSFPTETVYGLGARVDDGRAVARIFEAKNRPSFDPLIVHIARIEELDALVSGVTPLALRLIERFWPGPLTLVLPKKDLVPDIVTAGLPSVGVRMPAHPVARALIEETGVPLAAPSANPFGYISPTTASHVEEQLGERVDLILDGGPCAVGVESTIVKISGDGYTLLRPGGVTVEEIEMLAGARLADASGARAVPEAPGQMNQHYSPRTPVRVVKSFKEIGPRTGRCGLIAFMDPHDAPGFERIEVLSPTGDLREAAARLFASLHELDRLGLDVIYAEEVPEEGVGRAIMNRLRRAASRG
ncbi:MAG: threonylcarbamoyl-AMP synthase [Spirochaetes bacterium]|nr:MAG: threonylcarbamoyl-AMP synthase [Spirochaetota bacterium]